MSFLLRQNMRLSVLGSVSFLGIISLLTAVVLTPRLTADNIEQVIIFGLSIGVLRWFHGRETIGQRSMAGVALVIPALILFGPESVFWIVLLGLIFADVIFSFPSFLRQNRFRQNTLFSLCTLPISAVAGAIGYRLLAGDGGNFGFEYLGPTIAGAGLYLGLFTALSGGIRTLIWKPADPDNQADTPGFAETDSVTLLAMGILGIMNTFLIYQHLYLGLALAAFMTIFTGKLTKIASRNKHLYLGIINALMVLIELRDPYTKGHSDRVATYSVHIARAMGLPNQEIDNIYHAALLHDLGKTGVSQQILHKPGPLTKREYARIKEHVEISARIIGQIDYRGRIHQLIHAHHERYDGRGYPSGLKGEEIPLGARIIGVADAFDAMTSLRPYRQSFSIPQALEEIEDSSGTQLDPKVVKVAIPILKKLSTNFDLVQLTDDFPLRGVSSPLRKSFWEGDTSLLNRVDRSEFLDKLQVCGVLTYHEEKGLSQLPQELAALSPAQSALNSFGRQALEKGKILEDILVTEDEKVYHFTALPRGEEVNLVVLNLSEVLKVEDSHLAKVKSAYSQALHLITSGKFKLLAEEELPEWVGGKYLRNISLEDPAQVGEVIRGVQGLLKELNLPEERIEALLLCLHEAMGNVFKHSGNGQLSIVALADKIRIIVADDGAGFDIRHLPRILFKVEGPGKLRSGLALMLKCLDQVALCTSTNGTTLILEEKVAS